MDGLILASASPRRSQLLQWAEIEFEVMASHIEENYPPTMRVRDVPIHIAQKKALAVKHALSTDRMILAADTIVLLEDKILGKPSSRQQAVEMLQLLSGKTHEVITGVAMLQKDAALLFSDTTEVTFHPVEERRIGWYVDKYQPYDKAGAYAIQEWIGVVGIKSICGDFYNVMGLPVSRVVQALSNWQSE